MEQSRPAGIDSLLQTLEELTTLVSARPSQPIPQLAENAVVHWLRVVEGKEILRPRLNAAGFLPASFPFGMERNHQERMDAHPPAKEMEPYRREFSARLESLAELIDTYFNREGYRGSSEQCDQAMVELCRVSRFLGSASLDVELLAGALPHLNEDGSLAPEAGEEATKAGRLLRTARRNFLTWEPLLNEALVSWSQNSLNDFDAALAVLQKVLALPELERAAYQVPPGYPIRQRGRPRMKVSSFEPALRPQRTKSMFSVRQSQLQKRLEESDFRVTALVEGLREDMHHFITMIRRNHFMLAGEPSFWDTHRPGLPLVRGWPTMHPFLLDPLDFFKKAVLFHNRTYTVAGGGVDMMFLQISQLERYYKFQSPTGSRAIRQNIAVCLLRWEENRLVEFTEELLRLAEVLRAETSRSETPHDEPPRGGAKGRKF